MLGDEEEEDELGDGDELLEMMLVPVPVRSWGWWWGSRCRCWCWGRNDAMTINQLSHRACRRGSCSCRRLRLPSCRKRRFAQKITAQAGENELGDGKQVALTLQHSVVNFARFVLSQSCSVFFLRRVPQILESSSLMLSLSAATSPLGLQR